LLPTPGEQTPAYAELRRKLDAYANDKTLTDEQAFRAAQAARRQAEQANQPAPGQPGQPNQAAPASPTNRPGQPGQPNANQPEGVGLKDFAQQNEQILRDGSRSAGGDERGRVDGGPLPRGDVTAAPLPPASAAPAPAPMPSATPKTDVTPAAPKGPAATGAPVKIDSVAKGVPGKGLAELLSGAESLMKEGKFASALQEYDKAEQVAPNNPLILLARANAELGASSFARADQHLREAFNADAALLMGQYDLPAFLGEDRLKVIANDLKDIANKEQTQVRPVFLLAYVAYNSGNERMAAGYLDLADKRAGGKDPLIKKIREHWTLPAAEEPPVEAPAGQPAPPATPDRSEQAK
jgi:hypothetical protein